MRISKRAFSLIELLIVVMILGLLVTILMPTLSRARVLAKRSACAAQIKTFASAVSMYYGINRSYPFMGNANLGDPQLDGYPMMASVMAMNNVTPTRTSVDYKLPIYLPVSPNPDDDGLMAEELTKLWRGAFCPAMNVPGTYAWIKKNMDKAYRQRIGMGYQWNACLRAATPGPNPATLAPFIHCGIGRWSPKLENAANHAPDTLVKSIDPKLYLPNGTAYYAQAVTPDEVDNPGLVAQAWDSFDVNEGTENYSPGWHVGPASNNTNRVIPDTGGRRDAGQVVLNAARHDGSPNILYVDGHVAADADAEFKEGDSAGEIEIRKAVTWGDSDATYGTMHHIAPQIDRSTPP